MAAITSLAQIPSFLPLLTIIVDGARVPAPTVFSSFWSPATLSSALGSPTLVPGVSEIQRVGSPSAISRADPQMRYGHGRPMIESDRRTQKPVSLSIRASSTRVGTTRTRASHGPSSESSAGRSVTAATIETSGITTPPTPRERINGSGSMIRPASPTATVRPLNTTACPAKRIVGSSAARISSRVNDTRRASPVSPETASFCRWIVSISSRKR